MITFISNIEEYLGKGGLNNPTTLFFFSLLFIFAAVIGFYFLKAPRLLILMVGILMTSMFAIFEWLPVWILFLIAISLVAFFILNLNFKGGGASND